MAERDLLAFRRQVGFVFQEGALFDSMTVGENVAYRLREDRVKDDEIEAARARSAALRRAGTHPGSASVRTFRRNAAARVHRASLGEPAANRAVRLANGGAGSGDVANDHHA